jgi:pyrimidine operon attenuation protein/uracil phosphoribosyltransferase
MSQRSLELLNEEAFAAAVSGLAQQLASHEYHQGSLILIGIHTRGVPLAHRLASYLRSFGHSVLVGALDITFFRDDLQRLGLRTPDRTEIPQDLRDQSVVLVDDVLFKGRTIRAALDALNHFGRPKRVRLAVLVDRGHREFPIQPDYCGQVIPTQLTDTVRVFMQEIDGKDQVILECSDPDFAS